MTPKDDFEQLVNAGLPYAQEMLEKHGEFYPFGAVMTKDDQVHMVSGPEHEEVPPVDQVIASLVEGFRAGSEGEPYKAIALFTNVNVSFGQPPIEKETAAIQAALEHSEGPCLNVFMPYEERPDAAPEYGELVAAPREGEIYGEG